MAREMAQRAERIAGRRAERRAALAESHRLRSGIWVSAGPQLWRRLGGAGLPRHVQQTKGVVRGRTLRARISSRLRTVTRGFIVLRSTGTAEIAIIAFDGGVVLLDPAHRRVLRTYGHGPVTEQYVSWRDAFSQSVSAPRFEVAEEGGLVIEEMVDGEHLLEIDIARRLSVIRRLLRDFAELTRTAGETKARDLRSEMDPLVRGCGSERLLQDWCAADLAWSTESIAWVPSAYEATAKNLLVGAGDRPIAIDLGDLRPDPFFVYPIGIVVAAGAEVVAAFLAGTLDEELRTLFSSAGKTWRGTTEQRRGLLLLRLVYAASRDGEGPLEAAHAVVVNESICSRWAELEPMLQR